MYQLSFVRKLTRFDEPFVAVLQSLSTRCHAGFYSENEMHVALLCTFLHLHIHNPDLKYNSSSVLYKKKCLITGEALGRAKKVLYRTFYYSARNTLPNWPFILGLIAGRVDIGLSLYTFGTPAVVTRDSPFLHSWVAGWVDETVSIYSWSRNQRRWGGTIPLNLVNKPGTYPVIPGWRSGWVDEGLSLYTWLINPGTIPVYLVGHLSEFTRDYPFIPG